MLAKLCCFRGRLSTGAPTSPYLSNLFMKKFDREMSLFETVSNGNIAMFTYYPTGIFEETGHTILMTGAYTEPDGTHVQVAQEHF